MKRAVYVLGIISCLCGGWMGYSPAVMAQQYEDLEAKQLALDRRYVELQRERFRADRAGDEKAVEEIQKELDDVQRDSLDVMHRRGITLPRNLE